MESRKHEPITGLSVRKSNNFITAKYKSTLLENKIMIIALARIEVNAMNPATASLEAHLYPGELTKLVSDPTHIYRDLSRVSRIMTGRTMFLEDGKGNFKSFAVVTNAEYIDGVFTIRFNDEIREHVLGLEEKGGYTNNQISVMTDFNKNSSFRLYEVLRKEIYKIGKGENSYTEVEYNVSELKFMLGIANSDSPDVKKAISNMKKNDIDWDKLYDALDKKDKIYEDYRDFNKYIIKEAQEELEEKSDIKFVYEGIRENRKIKRVLFRIYRNIPKNPTIIDERKSFIKTMATTRQLELFVDMFPQFFEEYIGHNNLSKEDLSLLLEKSKMDVDLVKKAINKADSQKNMINNYMGWIISYIERKWDETSVLEGSVEKAEIVNDIIDNYEKKDKEQLAKNMWEKQKVKEDFDEFIEFVNLQIGNYTVEMLEVLYTYSELTQAYVDYKLKREINL